jgi:vanillate O-demethylase monooxygenase subunit
MPNVIRLVKDMGAGRYVIWLATYPVDFRTTQTFWVFARNYDLEPARDTKFRAMSAHVRLQDKPIIESQRPWLIPPFCTQIEMPMGLGDLQLTENQRRLQELGIAAEAYFDLGQMPAASAVPYRSPFSFSQRR